MLKRAGGLGLLALPLLFAQLVLAAPPRDYDFEVTPAVPLPGQTVTFTADGLKQSDTVAWDFNGDGTFDATGRTAQHVYAAPGTRTVTMRVTKDDGEVKQVVKTLRVDAPPTASFTATPNPATPGQPVEFSAGTSSDPDGTIVRYEWDLDGNGSFETVTGSTPTATRVYTEGGTYTVRLRVTDNDGASAQAVQTVVVNRRPVARLTAQPNPAAAGEPVTFDARGSSDPDGTIAAYAWDLDDDGQFDDGSAATAVRSFAAAGAYTVKVRVTDDRGATDTATFVVTVVPPAPQPVPPANQPPTASFTSSPPLPLVGDRVEFVSTSHDAQGALASQAWDLDNDGEFDDAIGEVAARTFVIPGSYTVALRVTDSAGAADVESRVINVSPRQGSPSVPAPLPTFALPRPVVSTPALMSPFPVVRIIGDATRFGAVIDRLIVRGAPRGATVTVRCRGRGCPRRSMTRSMPRGRLRIASLERRLRAGVVIRIYVTQSGRIGKYTSFRIRRSRAPLRRDLCVTSLGARPGPCPSS